MNLHLFSSHLTLWLTKASFSIQLGSLRSYPPEPVLQVNPEANFISHEHLLKWHHQIVRMQLEIARLWKQRITAFVFVKMFKASHDAGKSLFDERLRDARSEAAHDLLVGDFRAARHGRTGHGARQFASASHRHGAEGSPQEGEMQLHDCARRGQRVRSQSVVAAREKVPQQASFSVPGQGGRRG